MRSFVEANQEISRLNARSRDVPGPDAEPRPDYAGARDSAAPAGSPIASSAKP
ncbi:hypothetical protein [Streptomyces canus]|uniref:hypothetical protein n=1 Tax=Streptomyces canus TaxID=58343 RepID=UPI0036E4BD41